MLTVSHGNYTDRCSLRILKALRVVFFLGKGSVLFIHLLYMIHVMLTLEGYML